MSRVFKHLTMADRIKIEVLRKTGHSIQEIANIIRVHKSTISRELKRGRFTALTPELVQEERYSPDIANARYQENLRAKGPSLKIGKDLNLANYLETKIADEDYSPAAALNKIKADKKEFTVSICVGTLYSYIDKGIFLTLTNKDLPVKKNSKRVYKKLKKIQRRSSKGTSIEKRPETIDNRKEFGHWEMDTVKGKRGKSKNSLLVLTERKTRNEIIYKLPAYTSEAVVKALDTLENKWGLENFKKVFKTITVDNGNEFADVNGMERSVINPKCKRTQLYYCHPYSSWERGTNEVTNKMIRRKIPKGTNFDNKTDAEIKEIENWINTYPRRIHNYKSASELFKKELKNICC